MRVYVVGYAPANELGATGGFDWFPNPEPAIARARHDLREIGGLGAHSVTFVPLEVPDGVAYPGGVTTPDRDGITSWIDANLHLVEVGLEPTRSNDEDAATCIVYGCGEPADREGTISFALPGGGTAEARVCARHREFLAGDALRGVSLADPPGEPLSQAAREAVERLLDVPPPTQTRPSAIVRRPDPDTPVSEATVAELLTEALERARARRGDRRGGASGREFSIVVTLLEDAITRHNKGVYMERGVFAITDAERIPPPAEEG